ncbi:hypothetical protein [Pseudomonas asplenii]|uniref:hypothetical protein n=1 Tax=Pseudomonas asplenii TaxID=53407 RepID=UPI0022347120|nr:hypothetical protein [Pseudomonas asplenii]UZE30014.1 hypothetical protein LOY63_04540 [Pseudomonas asplenii]
MNREQFLSKLIIGRPNSSGDVGIRFDAPEDGADFIVGSEVNFIASAIMLGKVQKIEIVSDSTVLASVPGDKIDVTIPLRIQGTYDCVVRAFDDLGNTAISWPPLPVYVHGGPQEVFEVRLLQPEEGLTYNNIKGIPFEVSVKLPDDPDKRVVKVECYLNAYTIRLFGVPYTVQLPTEDFGIGTHHVSAKVFLQDGSDEEMKEVTVSLEEGEFRAEVKVIPPEGGFIRWSDVRYEGSAFSDAGVRQLELINQDGYVLTRTEGPGPLVFWDKLWSVGTHTVRIRATDTMGNQRESHEESFRVLPRPGDNHGVSLRSPQNGGEYHASLGRIDLLPTVSIVDTWSPIALRVEYWEGGLKIAQASNGPYGVNWAPYDGRREYRIRAKVIVPDPQGDFEFESQEVHFVVK